MDVCWSRNPENNHEPQTFGERVVTAMWLGQGKINCLLCRVEDLRRQLFRCRPQELLFHRQNRLIVSKREEKNSLRQSNSYPAHHVLGANHLTGCDPFSIAISHSNNKTPSGEVPRYPKVPMIFVWLENRQAKTQSFWHMSTKWGPRL